ncbi:Gas vesicle synthesis protein GvpO [Streptomyces sp. DvalAA-14]|nr:Gas vesicle synthesis protein GvpO [Streptomyces sp. DvalAA-14]
MTNASEAARRAARSLTRLIGHPAEGSSEVSQVQENHWRVCVDVLEVERIPDTTSLMATYEVELDEDGSLLSYRRVRRYRRGAADR